jgi:hypothetical protein
MLFKDDSLEAEFNQLCPLLQLMAGEFDRCCKEWFGFDAVVTRVFEDIPGASKLHPEGHAIDFRDQFSGKFTFTQDQRERLLTRINSLVRRPSLRAALIWHSFSPPPPLAALPFHFHMQIGSSLAEHSDILKSRTKTTVDGTSDKV